MDKSCDYGGGYKWALVERCNSLRPDGTSICSCRGQVEEAEHHRRDDYELAVESDSSVAEQCRRLGS